VKLRQAILILTLCALLEWLLDSSRSSNTPRKSTAQSQRRSN